MSYLEIRKFLFNRNLLIFRSIGWNFQFLPNPYRKLKTNFNIELAAIFLFFLNNTKINPNSVTYFGIAWVYLGTFFFYLNSDLFIIFGLIIFFTKLIPDYIDGALANLKNKQSKKGHLLDVFAGKINQLGVKFGVLIYIYNSTNNLNNIYILLVLLLLFLTDPRTYFIDYSNLFFDSKINSHQEKSYLKKKNISKIINFIKFFNYEGQSYYTDFILILILIEYFFYLNNLLIYFPYLWLLFSIASYLRAWFKYLNKTIV